MKQRNLIGALLGMLLLGPNAGYGQALIATGTLDASGPDLSPQTAKPLENGTPGNLFGGIGSGLAFAGGDRFVAVPDRGPNAVPYNDCIDDTASYITRFHDLRLRLVPSTAPGLPFELKPSLEATTLMASATALTYGDGLTGCPTVPDGAPRMNKRGTFYFTGRSDNFGPGLSTNSSNARFDPESVRLSRDGKSIFVSDEYGPYIYRFDRTSGLRTAVYTLPDKFAVSYLSAQGDVEIDFTNNPIGRVANKGMEGLAITPDDSTLVGIMQSALEQDGGDNTGQVVRIITIDVDSGAMLHEYAYPTDTDKKYTVSDIVAVTNDVFLVDERDGKGFADVPGSEARFKKLFLIDLSEATDVTLVEGHDALAAAAVPKKLFLDVVKELTKSPANGGLGLTKTQIPAKLEGLAFGQDVLVGDTMKHTLFIANDNDFLPTFDGRPNPNQFYVFAFGDADLQRAFGDAAHATLGLQSQMFQKK